MKKNIVFLIIYNVIFLVFAIFAKILENNNVSILYMILLLLISDFFFIVFYRKNMEYQRKLLKEMESKKESMIEQERLSSLGQLIGGIAHNLKTPIMSISGSLEGLSDLVREYDESIEDKEVTEKDHHDIASEMKEWIKKIKEYLSYMTEVINTVKGQAVSMNVSSDNEFFIKELILRSQILMKDELKRRKCNLNVDIKVDENIKIKGELNALVQVIDNLIMNSMDAYKDNGGEINLNIYEEKEKIYIEVEDFAGGIPEDMKDKLFKEMVTTKGKNGTGLGLYISYSTIKGKFGGNISFESELNKGTKFLVELNKR